MKKNDENKLQSVTKDMENIIDNITNQRISIEQVKSTLEVMVKECKEVLSK